MTQQSYLPPIPRPPHDPTSWLLNARVGWKQATLAGVEPRPADGALALAPMPGAGRSLLEPGGSFGGLVAPANVAAARDGSIYLLDLQCGLLKRFDACACAFRTVPCLGQAGGPPRHLDRPHGMAICSGNLFVCDTGNRRVAVFSLRQFAFRGDWLPPATSLPWSPFAVAFDSRGRAFVTDTDHGSVHRFDNAGRWEKVFTGFGPVTYIAIDCLDRIHLVITGAPGIRTIDAQGSDIPISPAPTTKAAALSRPDILAVAFPPPPFPVDAAGNLHLAALLSPSCLPKPPVRGQGRPAAEPGVFDLHGNPITLPILPPPAIYPLPKPPATPSGSYISVPLDSLLYRCVWHRVAISGQIPAGTRITIRTFTSEVVQSDSEIQALPDEAWQTNQGVSRLDGDGKWDCLVRSPAGRYLWLQLLFYSNGTMTPAFESIRIEFPRISLRRYLPAVFGAEPVSADFTDRFLSLFDTVFRSIERQIDNEARLFDPLSSPAKALGSANIDFLSWLGSWIGVSMDRQWPEPMRRAFLKQAGGLSGLRGTREGLRRQLLLFLGMEPKGNRCSDALPRACCPPKPLNCRPAPPARRWEPPPLILEHYQLRRWLLVGQGRLGDEAMLWGSSIVNRSQLGENARVGGTQLISTPDPYHDPFDVYANQFTVFVPARFGRDAQKARSLNNLLKSESPAHAKYAVRYVEPRFRVGVQATIGLDSVIASVPEGVTLGRTTLDGSRTLTAPPDEQFGPSFEVGKQSRIGGARLS